jgi:hypothetical protein
VLGIGLLVTARLRDEWGKLDEIQRAIEAQAAAAEVAGSHTETDLRDFGHDAPAASVRSLR